MRVVMIAALAVCLGGCIPQSIIRDRAVEQNVTIEDITDTILVANILRARDQAPLQFADIPLMHESFQITGGVTPTFLFGPVRAGTDSDSVAPTISIQEAPTFDVSNLDTQDFVTGIMSPVKPRVVKYWLDRGLDDRISLLLFFSSVTITVGKGDNALSLKIFNDPRKALTDDAETSGFLAYLGLVNSIAGDFRVIEAPDLSPVGPPFSLDMDKQLRAAVKIDPDKYEIDPLEPNKDPKKAKDQPYTIVENPDEGVVYPRYQLFAVSDKKVLICFNSPRSPARSPADRRACTVAGGAPAGAKPAEQPYRECPSPADFLKTNDCRATLNFTPRSAGDVVHFLGDLVWLQEHNLLPQARLHNPVTLKYCRPDEPPPCSEGGVLFNIAHETEQNPGRLRVPYRGDFYTVPNASPEDHTLQVLAIASQLINLTKSAKELRSTPTVQIVP